MNKDNKSIEIIKDLYKITNENNINNCSMPLSFNETQLTDDYFKEMQRSKFYFLFSLKFKVKKFLKLYAQHVYIFLKKVKRINGKK